MDPLWRGGGQCATVPPVPRDATAVDAEAAARRARAPGDTAEEAYVRLRDLIVEGVYSRASGSPHGRS